MGDVVGTITSGLRFDAVNDRLHIRFFNETDVASFVAGNKLGTKRNLQPSQGPLSPVTQNFLIDIPNPNLPPAGSNILPVQNKQNLFKINTTPTRTVPIPPGVQNFDFTTGPITRFKF